MFGIGIFKIKWPKSEEKLEFGVGSFLVAAPLPPNLKIVPEPLGATAPAAPLFPGPCIRAGEMTSEVGGRGEPGPSGAQEVKTETKNGKTEKRKSSKNGKVTGFRPLFFEKRPIQQKKNIFSKSKYFSDLQGTNFSGGPR